MITLEKECHLCDGVIHTWVPEDENCARCAGTPHGPSHKPFTKGHRPHCSANCCF
jgi:hypothetical protein